MLVASRTLYQSVNAIFESSFNVRELSAFDFGVFRLHTKRGGYRVRDDEPKRKATRIVLVGAHWNSIWPVK